MAFLMILACIGYMPSIWCIFCLQAYYILDEVLIAGELQESSKKSVARVIAAQVLAFIPTLFCFNSASDTVLKI